MPQLPRQTVPINCYISSLPKCPRTSQGKQQDAAKPFKPLLPRFRVTSYPWLDGSQSIDYKAVIYGPFAKSPTIPTVRWQPCHCTTVQGDHAKMSEMLGFVSPSPSKNKKWASPCIIRPCSDRLGCILKLEIRNIKLWRTCPGWSIGSEV